MAATVTVSNAGRIASTATLSAVKVTIDANSVSYATSLGGLAIDLYAALAAAGPFSAVPNALDIIGVQALGVTSPGKFIPVALTVGTQVTSSIPCYVKLIGTGTAASSGLAEIA